jgi:hypothetical protein
MRPTVGRIVHYQAFGTPGGEYKSLPRAAIITAVDDIEYAPPSPFQESGYRVALCILNPTGQFFNVDVKFDPEGKPGTWRWPPREG